MNTMDEEQRRVAFAEWLSTRPECVQRLAAEFPFGAQLSVDGKQVFVIGYNESDQLIVSHLEPSSVTFDEAMATRKYVCADHFREHPSDELDYKYEDRP